MKIFIENNQFEGISNDKLPIANVLPNKKPAHYKPSKKITYRNMQKNAQSFFNKIYSYLLYIEMYLLDSKTVSYSEIFFVLNELHFFPF